MIALIIGILKRFPWTAKLLLLAIVLIPICEELQNNPSYREVIPRFIRHYGSDFLTPLGIIGITYFVFYLLRCEVGYGSLRQWHVSNLSVWVVMMFWILAEASIKDWGDCLAMSLGILTSLILSLQTKSIDKELHLTIPKKFLTIVNKLRPT
jgi:hypothetical protein